jgi:signal transduction histidine kinase
MTSVLGMPQARFELAMAVLVTAGIELELALHGLIERPSQAVAAAFIGLPLAVRFRWPLPALVVVCGASLTMTVLGIHSGEPILPLVAVLLALYAVGSRCRGWQFWAGGLFTGACAAAQVLIREGWSFDITLAIGIPAAGLLVGRALGVLTFETDVLEERASKLERERDARVRQAVADERSRIARELHDVIGHSISVMGVQAGAVRRRLTDDQEQEREVLLAIEGTGRQAVGEMRRLIGLLRTQMNGFEGPSPSLRQIDTLVDEMRSTGLAIELDVTGDPSALPPGVDLAGYRIIQEALTNVLKHAARASVTVRVGCERGELTIDVVDDGAGTTAAEADHVGHGLVGMRERTGLYGGTLRTGPRAEGGFEVHARIPLEAA